MTLKASWIAPGLYKNYVETDRAILDAEARGVAGVLFTGSGTTMAGITDLQVQVSTGHNIQVAVGKAIIREAANPFVRGAYFFQADAIDVEALHVPDVNPFIDTVIARVTDPQYGTVTGVVGPRIDVLKGTVATSPIPLSDAAINALTGVPGGWTRLADVRVNVGDSGAIPVGQITDTRKPGGFGIVNCLSTNRPLNPTTGLEIFEMDTKAKGVWEGLAWQVHSIGWTAYTPYLNSTVVNPVMLAGNRVGQYRVNAGMVDVEASFIFTALGTGEGSGSGTSYVFGLPVNANASYVVDAPVGVASVLDASTGTVWGGTAHIFNTTGLYFQMFNNRTNTASPMTPANGDRYFFQARYRP